MNEDTFNRRLDQLIREVMQHPNMHELVELAQEQLIDDTFELETTDL